MDSGRVVDFWPLEQAIDINEHPKIAFCIEHWEKGVAWENTGVLDHMEKILELYGTCDDCLNLDDVKERYFKLDKIFNNVKIRGRLLTRKEINPKNFRECGGILIHLGPDGEPFFAEGGFHRFAMAYILGVPFPAQIGCVHITAISHLSYYRNINKKEAI